MIPVFVDTSFFVAILNDRDPRHAIASETAMRHVGNRLTTEFVLTEVANFCLSKDRRTGFGKLVANLRTSRRVEIAAASAELFDAGLSLFMARPDKEWSLTDCTSFVVMQDRGLTYAMTFDRDFKQAGFLTMPALE